MCYSAEVFTELRKLERTLGVKLDVNEFVKIYFIDEGRNPYKKRTPRGMDIDLLQHGPPEVAALIRERDSLTLSELEQELFKQVKRVADAQRALKVKETKKALNDLRIGGNKVDQIKAKIASLKRTEIKSSDNRIYPGTYVPVVVLENGNRVVKPMRYQCRLAGKPAFYDTKYPGTYNARRDNLEGFWKGQFGHTHGLMVATAFYEHVEQDGENIILEFSPQMEAPMLVACLWSRWEKDGEELLSFAAITDDPPAEVAEAGHDRCIIPIKPEHVDAWLDPKGDLTGMYAILDDRERPYYEHRKAA